MHRALITIVAIILLSISLLAADYSLPTGRLPGGANWSRARYGVEGGIPDSSGMTIFTNISPGTSVAAINAVFAACPSNRVIQFLAGTHNLDNELEIGYDGVVMRGAGPGVTTLVFTGGDGFGGGLIEVSGTFAGDSSGVAKNWTGGLTQGSTVLTLANVTDLEVGDVVSLDQLDDSNIGATANGETFLSRASGARPQGQVVRITAINGSTVTISHPVSMTNFQTALTAQLNRNGTPLQMIGIEDMTITNAAPDAVADYNIYFQGAWNCWVKNVESRRAEKSHIRGYWSGRIEIRHSDFRETWDYGSQSYGVNCSYYASWWLVEDNIFDELTTPMFNWGAGGDNVFIYNYVGETRYDNSPTWQINSMGTHGAHQTMCLYEGNYTPNLEGDFIHGSSSHNVGFRNRLTGRYSTDITANAYPVILERNNRFWSLVGNVLGYDGWHTGVRLQNANPSDYNNKAIYKLGYAGTSLDLGSYDTAVTNTVLILGNYNTVDDAIPAAESLGSDTLPISLMYDDTPTWWPVAMPHPPFSPSGAQLTASLTAMAHTNLPAGWRYQFGSEFSGGGGGGGSGAPSAYGVTARVGTVRAP